MKTLPLIALLAVTATAAASPARADTRRYAVVVAHTESLSGKVAPLEFADDDGARYFELLSAIADDVSLFTVLDRDSQRLYPEAATAARAPRRADVLAGLDRTFRRARADVERGHDVEFTFVLIGHGELGAGGEGYVSLIDAPFTRTDLYQQVLAHSPATTNHVIVDACNSYFLVHRRGGDVAADDGAPSRRDALARFVAREAVSRHPNTGFLLSTSSEKESHEWSAYGAGVFSHQVRSALAGAADVNGDGRVEYSEVEAFVAAANLRVDDPRARIELFARAPAIDAARPLVDLTAAGFEHWLRIPRGEALRAYLEDARGVRYADVHTSGERDVVLGLVGSAFYFVRTSDDAREVRIPMQRPGRRDLRTDAMRRPTIARRGAVAEAFRLHLYAEPYGPSFYKGYAASHGARAVATTDVGWLPALEISATAAAGEVDALLERLNDGAARDAALRARLRAAAPAVLRAVERQDYAAAMRLLDAAERTR